MLDFSDSLTRIAERVCPLISNLKLPESFIIVKQVFIVIIDWEKLFIHLLRREEDEHDAQAYTESNSNLFSDGERTAKGEFDVEDDENLSSR